MYDDKNDICVDQRYTGLLYAYHSEDIILTIEATLLPCMQETLASHCSLMSNGVSFALV